MVPETESLAVHLACRVILLCVLLMTSACSDDEPVKTTVTCNCPPAESETTVTHEGQAAPATAQSRMYMMRSRTFDQAPVQQGWGLQGQGKHPVVPPPPVYDAMMRAPPGAYQNNAGRR